MYAPADHSALVEVFLYEGRVDDAWREAKTGGCSNSLWLRLAGQREKDHPEDAAPVYLERAEAELGMVRNSRYEEPVALLVKAAGAMKRLGQTREFAREVEALRVRHKAKRNFLKLLDANAKKLGLA